MDVKGGDRPGRDASFSERRAFSFENTGFLRAQVRIWQNM